MSTNDTLNYVKNTASLDWYNIKLVNTNEVINVPTHLKFNMTAADAEAINFGNELYDDLSGVQGDLSKIFSAFKDYLESKVLDGDNVISVTSTADGYTIDSGLGNDKITGNVGADSINGGDGNDTEIGGLGVDSLIGGTGSDSLDGGAGDDLLYSGDGNDTVSAGDGSDLIVGGDGAGDDTYDGGSGIDTVKYTSSKASITVDLSKGTATSTAGKDAAGIGNDKLKNIEFIIAGDYADTLIGSKDANSIVGGLGNDTLDGGLGKDTLVGGDGADTFVFSTTPATTNMDTISDFQVGVDKIQLSSKVFTKLKGSDYLAFGTASDSASHYLIYDSTSGKLSYDADGNLTKIKPVDIALIGQGLQLTAQDIVVI